MNCCRRKLTGFQLNYSMNGADLIMYTLRNPSKIDWVIIVAAIILLTLYGCSTTPPNVTSDNPPKIFVPPHLMQKSKPLTQLPDNEPVSQKDATGIFIKWAEQYNDMADQLDDLIDSVTFIERSK